MISKSDLEQRISISQSELSDIISRSQRLAKELETLVKDIEKFEYRNCRDSIGQNLGISRMVKVRDILSSAGTSYLHIRKVADFRNKMSLAFDALRDIVESKREAKS